MTTGPPGRFSALHGLLLVASSLAFMGGAVLVANAGRYGVGSGVSGAVLGLLGLGIAVRVFRRTPPAPGGSRRSASASGTEGRSGDPPGDGRPESRDRRDDRRARPTDETERPADGV